MSGPRISILIPTYNRAGMLVKAVESALAQTYPDLEILVSDNASEDETAKVMARFTGDPRLSYLRNQSNVGMVANWRQSMLRATGDFFLVLSDDDELIDSEYLRKAAALIQQNKDMVLLYANGYILDSQTGERRELRLPFTNVENGCTIFASRDRVLPQDFTLCNVLFQRSLALQLNAFSNPNNLCCDSELFLSSSLFGKVGVIHDFVSLYRVHPGNLIATVSGNFDLLTHSLDMYLNPYRLARQRQGLSRDELRAFEIVMQRAVLRVILEICEYHPKSFRHFLSYLNASNPPMARRILSSRKFWKGLSRILRRRWGLFPPQKIKKSFKE